MNDTHAVSIGDLIVGRELGFPVHDLNGVLLLAAGSPITTELKKRLLERGVTQVRINKADLDAATSAVMADDTDEEASLLRTPSDPALDSMVQGGRLNVRNTGPAFRQRILRHGRRAFDPRLRERVKRQHAQTCSSISELTHAASRLTDLDARSVNELADVWMNSLAADLGCTLSTALFDNQDVCLAGHALNVALLGMSIGIEMGFDADNVRTIGIAGLVQDLGMAQVPKEILETDRKLNAVEFLEIEKHAIRTANLLERLRGIPALVQVVVYQIHERPDGSGYPRRRCLKDIHIFARILHVADAFVAMTTPRSYRPAMMPYAAMECLIRQARENRVDAGVVRCLLRVLSLFPIGSYVRLSDGSTARVLRLSGDDYTKPTVQRVCDHAGRAVRVEDDSSLIDLSRSNLAIVQALPTPGTNEISLRPELMQTAASQSLIAADLQPLTIAGTQATASEDSPTKDEISSSAWRPLADRKFTLSH
jgi:HD-GYP domain-containing protein (c-di-GMP phosphodiesterase class II)